MTQYKALAVFLACALLPPAVAESTQELEEMSRERLAACPKSPNCVSSMAEDGDHKIAPLAYSGPPEDAYERVKQIIESMSRSKITKDEYPYLHAEFHSLVFHFVDDLEILVNPEDQVIDIRSASRAGYSDFGVNGRRVDEIRQKLAG